jgi:hypothetical protein
MRNCDHADSKNTDRVDSVPNFLFSKPTLRIALLAILLSLIAGCGRASIVGRWRQSGDQNPMVWQFSQDRSVLIGDARGRYSLGDGNRIKIETPFATAVYRMEFSGDQMILTDTNGSRLKFARIQQGNR